MDEIIPGLWLGDFRDAQEAPKAFAIVSVCEFDELDKWHRHPSGHVVVPVFDFLHVTLDMNQLEGAAQTLDKWLARVSNDFSGVLVHCALGMERSPLTIVYYLVTRKHMNLMAAYDLVCEKHPQTQRRMGWLPREWRINNGPIAKDLSERTARDVDAVCSAVLAEPDDGLLPMRGRADKAGDDSHSAFV